MAYAARLEPLYSTCSPYGRPCTSRWCLLGPALPRRSLRTVLSSPPRPNPLLRPSPEGWQRRVTHRNQDVKRRDGGVELTRTLAPQHHACAGCCGPCSLPCSVPSIQVELGGQRAPVLLPVANNCTKAEVVVRPNQEGPVVSGTHAYMRPPTSRNSKYCDGQCQAAVQQAVRDCMACRGRRRYPAAGAAAPLAVIFTPQAKGVGCRCPDGCSNW